MYIVLTLVAVLIAVGVARRGLGPRALPAPVALVVGLVGGLLGAMLSGRVTAPPAVELAIGFGCALAGAAALVALASVAVTAYRAR